MEKYRKIYIAVPHGMCAGVRRALATVDRVLECFPAPVFVLHELVHNNYIVNQLTRRGVVFAETLDEVPDGAVLLFSAHGVGAAVEAVAQRKHLRIVDATCPLVKRLQLAAAEAVVPGGVLVLIGHRGHPEVEGVLGRAGTDRVQVIGSVADVAQLPELPPGTPIRQLAQTTLNQCEVETVTTALRQRFPQLETGPGVCYATTNRQAAIRLLARRTPVILVIGSPRSSNSNRLREIAELAGARAFLIDGPDELPLDVLEAAASIGVSAGASAPEELVILVLERLAELGFSDPEPVVAAEELLTFQLPVMPD